MATAHIDKLPEEILQDILSRLGWRQQLAVRRVSHRWQRAADTCMTRRRELCISEADLRDTRLNTEVLLNVLQKMPSLRSLKIDSHGSDEDVLTKTLTMEQLCASCPRLQEVSLNCSLQEASVKTLLRGLPGLRKLHLSHATAEGNCLSLLPEGLQSLSLFFASKLSPNNFWHLTRCRQLRELDLSGTQVPDEVLEEIVAGCSQLQRLAVGWTSRLTTKWLAKLRLCPQLHELDISDLLEESQLNLSGVLTDCRRLEKLRVYNTRNPLSSLSTTSPLRITHLDLSSTDTDDITFRCLPELLPDLRDLKLKDCSMLRGSELAGTLPRFSGLQVLDLRGVDYGSTEMLVSSIRCLSLKALAYDCHKNRVADVLRCCPALTLLSPVGLLTSSYASWIADELVRDASLAGREVTLIVPPEIVGILGSKLPRNYRVLASTSFLWEALVTGKRTRGLFGHTTNGPDVIHW